MPGLSKWAIRRPVIALIAGWYRLRTFRDE